LRAPGARGLLAPVPTFLFKTEPSEYSFADLVRDKRTTWEGVSNALALIHLRSVKKGDTIVIYHTGAEKRAVGLAMASRGAYPDPNADDGKRVVVDLKPLRALPEPVTLAVFKRDPVLCATELVRLSRLSVMPITDAQLARVLELAKA
jgi:predicted RNA-binding protein with PUA-like domain